MVFIPDSKCMVAIIGFDTAENELSEVCPTSAYILIFHAAAEDGNDCH